MSGDPELQALLDSLDSKNPMDSKNQAKTVRYKCL